MIQSSIVKDRGYATETETDIFGVCPTGFEFSKSGGTLTIQKSRDLNKCAHREDITLPFLATPYDADSDVQSSSLIDSSLRSEQQIEGGILKSALLQEVYEYGPGVSGAEVKVTIKTTLNHVNTALGAIPALCNVPRTIIFEKEHPQEGIGISNKIVDLVRQGTESRTIGPDTAQKFSQLVRTVAAASKQDIQAALQHVKSGPGIKDRNSARRMLLDAVLMAQSASSVEIMADLLKRKEDTGYDRSDWLLGLGAVTHASRASLLAVLPLLDGEPETEAFLGIGALAGKFCREHACEGVNEVNQLQIKLGAPLLKGCNVNSKGEEDHLIASLKGLGNIKYLGSKIAGKIIECVQDQNVRPRIRVAALETIATDPNKEQFKSAALTILKNFNEDSEIRIKAYQVLAKCPCGKVAAAIKELLEKEESNQVGGYIVSHLRNLHASTNPDKVAARHFLGDIIPPSRFIIDPRRYSVNQELSYAADIVNTGATGEADIIYSKNSFLPRSVSLNLTTQLFGTAYNLLQIDARQENLELIAERLFGPRGYLKTNDIENVIEDGRDSFSDLLERIAARYDQSLRPKRSINRAQVDNIATRVNLPRSSDEIEFDISLKVLGSEVAWENIHSSESETPESLIDDYFDSLDSIIHELKNSDIDYRRHVTIIDSEVTYPTGLGLALQLKTIGSAALRLHLDGKVDIPAILRDPDNTDIRFQLEPSAAINVNGEMAIDAVAFQSGVKVDLNIHTSTGSDVTFRILNGRGVDVRLGLPLPKQDIISVKTEVNSIIRSPDQSTAVTPVQFDLTRETYSGCFDQLSGLTGLTFCGHITAPSERKAVYPLFAPIELGLSIDKEDASLTFYHFRTLHDYREDNRVHSFEFLLDTPNTKIPRKLSFNAEGSLYGPEIYFKARSVNPFLIPESISLEANVVCNKNEQSINARLLADDDEYTARIGARSSGSGNKIRYEPILEYRAPEEPKSSNLIGKKGGQKKQGQSLTATGSLTVDRSAKQNRLTFQGLGVNTPRTPYKVDGTLIFEPNGLSSDLKISYEDQHITIKGKGEYSKTDLHGHLEIAPSEFPDLGISVTLDSTTDNPEGHYEDKLVIVHGPDPNNEYSRIYIHSKWASSPGGNDTVIPPFSFVHEVKYPVLQLDAGINGEVTSRSIGGGIRGQLDKYSARLEGAIEVDSKAEGDYQASFVYELMGNELRLISSRSLEGVDTSRFTNILILKPGGTYQANALVVHKLNSDEDYQLKIDADASTPDKSEIKLQASAQRKGTSCQGNLNLKIGDKTLISGTANHKGGNAPNGAFTLSIPGHLETEGKLNSDGVLTTSSASINLPQANRKIDIKGESTIKEPKYSALLIISLDPNDPSEIIKIQTDNEFKLNEDETGYIDSRNTLSLGNDVIQINGKAKVTGNEVHGSSLSEIEITLPDGYVFGGKIEDSQNFEGQNKELAGFAEIYHHPKGGKPEKLTARLAAKHIDPEEGTVDCHLAIGYLQSDDKEATAHIALKKLPTSSGKTSNVNAEVGLQGSLIEDPILLTLESEISDEYFADDSKSIEDDLPPITYKYTAVVGQDLRIEGKGKIKGNVVAVEVSGTLPKESEVRNFKIVSNNIVDVDDDLDSAKIKLDNSVHWNDKHFVSSLIQAEVKDDSYEYVLQYETDTVSKRRLSGSARYSDEHGYKGDVSFAGNIDGQNNELSIKGEINKDETESNFHIIANLPCIHEEKTDIVIKTKILSDEALRSDIIITSKDGKRALSTNLDLDDDHPLIELIYDHPSGKSRFYYKGDWKSESHYTSELRAKWTMNGGGSLSADTDINFESEDNFHIKYNYESTVSDPKKLLVDINNKPGKADNQKITILVKVDDQNLLSGTVNYNYKEEGDVHVLEGNGNIKYKEESYPLTFHGSEQAIEPSGLLTKLNAKAGKITLNAEHKTAPGEYHFERTLCVESNKCSKAQYTNRLKSGPHGEEQTIILILDFSTFVVDANDFSFKLTNKREDLNFEHVAEVQLSPRARLASHAYIRDTSAGAYLSLPKRTIGGEAKYDVKKRGNGQTLKFEADLYINKEKEPKLCLLGGTTVLYDKGVVTLAGEAKITHPSLGKDLVARGQVKMSEKSENVNVDGSLEIDVSPNANNKIIGTLKVTGNEENAHTVATLKSKGCKVDIHYEEKVRLIVNGTDSSYLYSEQLTWTDAANHKNEYLGKLEVSKDRIVTVLKLPHLLVDGQFNVAKGYSGSLNLFGRKYSDSLVYNEETNSVKYQFNGLEGGKVLTLEAGGKIGGKGVLRAALNDQNACNLDVALDEKNFLESKYTYNTEVLKNIYAAFAKEVNLLSNQCSKSIQNIADRQIALAKQFLECVSKAKPDLSGAEKYLDDQLKQLRDEIENDKELNDALEFLDEMDGGALELVAVVLEELSEFLKVVDELGDEVLDTLQSALTEIQPKVQQSLQRLSKVFNTVVEQYVNLTIKLVDLLLDELKQHEADIDAFTDAISEFLEELGKLIGESVVAINQELEEWVKQAVGEAGDIPIIAAIQENLQELENWKVPEEIISLVHEIIEQLKQLLPTNEATQFVSTAGKLLEQVLKDEDIKDEDEALEKLFSEFIAALKSLVDLIVENSPDTASLKSVPINQIPLANVVRGSGTGGLRVSILDLLASDDFWPSIEEFFSRLTISLNPLDDLPPFSGHGLVIGGSEVITFDSLHLGVPADCSYVLAEDFRDRNFSIVGQFGNGALRSITILSRQDSIELGADGSTQVNGSPTTLPKHIGDLKAWRKPGSVGAWSSAGVLILCTERLEACSIEVNGFYIGRIRGLLGNLNGEQYDERTTPEGTIVKTTGELADTWKLDPACSVPTTVGHKHVRNDECTRIFEDEPVITLCRPFVNPAPYRDACDHLANINKAGVCSVMQAYVHHCRSHGFLLAEVPDSCATCSYNGKTIENGDSESVSTLTAADIVIATELYEDNEENYKQIAHPLLAAVRSELNKAGINDIRVFVVGGPTPTNHYPSFFTDKQGRCAHEPAIDELWFEDRPIYTNQTFVDTVRLVGEFLKRESGLGGVNRLYKAVLDNPLVFRPNAHRIVIGVHGERCPELLPGVLVQSLLRLFDLEVQGIQYNVIVPITDVEKDDEEVTVAVLAEEDGILPSGEPIQDISYEETDPCVISATQTGGVAISADVVKSSPRRPQLIQEAAARIVKELKAKQLTLDCDCELYKGTIPNLACTAA